MYFSWRSAESNLDFPQIRGFAFLNQHLGILVVWSRYNLIIDHYILACPLFQVILTIRRILGDLQIPSESFTNLPALLERQGQQKVISSHNPYMLLLLSFGCFSPWGSDWSRVLYPIFPGRFHNLLICTWNKSIYSPKSKIDTLKMMAILDIHVSFRGYTSSNQ